MRFPVEVPEEAVPIVAKHTAPLGIGIEELRGGKKGRHPDRHKEIVAVCAKVALELWDMEWSGPQIGRLLHKHHTTVGVWLRAARKRARADA